MSNMSSLNLVVNPNEEVILPKKLYAVLRRISWNQPIEEALEWLTVHPQQRKVFSEVLSQLDSYGINVFIRLTSCYQNIKEGRTPLFNAKRALELQMIRRKRKALTEEAIFKGIRFMLADGIPCIIRRPPVSHYDAPFEATITYGAVTIILNLTTSQTLRLVDASNKLETLKRMKIKRVRYKTDEYCREIDKKFAGSIVNALAKGLPIEIAALMSFK